MLNPQTKTASCTVPLTSVCLSLAAENHQKLWSLIFKLSWHFLKFLHPFECLGFCRAAVRVFVFLAHLRVIGAVSGRHLVIENVTTMFSQNVRHQSGSDIEPYYRRPKLSVLLLPTMLAKVKKK
jgi:hypothetical protein